MANIQMSSRTQKPKNPKRKNRSRHHIYSGTPQVPLTTKQHKQQHELLSDWENSS